MTSRPLLSRSCGACTEQDFPKLVVTYCPAGSPPMRFQWGEQAGGDGLQPIQFFAEAVQVTGSTIGGWFGVVIEGVVGILPSSSGGLSPRNRARCDPLELHVPSMGGVVRSRDCGETSAFRQSFAG